MRKYFLIISCLVLITSVKGQDVWTLEKCVEYALSNNIQIKQQMLQVKSGQATVLQDQLTLLPSLNGFAMHGYNWGKTVDRYTNQFATQRVQTDNFYLSSSLTLFDGFQKINQIKQSKMDLEAANYDNDKFMDDITLGIATGYLQILFYKELLKTAENQLQATDLQVARLQKMVTAGALAVGDLYNIQAQRATENVQVVDSRNNLDLAYLTLAQMLDLPSTDNFEIETPELELGAQPSLTAMPEQVYGFALENQPMIKSAEYRLKSSEYMLNQSKGSLLPSLSLQGSLGTGYSGAASQVIDSYIPAGTQVIGFVDLPGGSQDVYALKYDPVWKDNTFSNQVSDNVNKSLSFNLSIPIFNGWSSRTAISKAKLNVENAKYNLDLKKLELRKTIQQAYADAKAALNKYYSSITGVEAAKESFRYAEEKFTVGTLNSVDYNNAKINFEKAESSLLQAKFEFIFKTTVLDFYMGKPITLNRK
ncbi:MAG: TolC family protein [Lentimicrobiaceae bacterium]|jgi:outer membrane protein